MSEREFQAFCVGTAKSGTHSVAAMLERRHRCAHEPRPLETLMLGELARLGLGRLLRPVLRRRDRRLRLELESSHLLGPLARELARTFPRARFILTLRDPESWLRSILAHRRDRPPLDRWARWWHWLRFEHPPHRERRPAAGPAAAPEQLDRYLRYWRDHNLAVLRGVPAERLLVVRLRDLDRSSERLAHFLGVEPGAVEERHEFRGRVSPDPLSAFDASDLERRLERFLDPQILRHLEPLTSDEGSSR